MLIIEVAIAVICLAIAFLSWSQFCGEGLEQCFSQASSLDFFSYLGLSILRPLTFFPFTLFSVMGIKAFGPIAGSILVVLSSILSTTVFYVFGKVIGKKLVNPWLSSNLPQTLKFLRSQDWKAVIALRLIPFFPFDFLSFLFGVMDFRFRYVLAATAVGILPEIYLAMVFADPGSSLLGASLLTYSFLCLILVIPGLIFEIYSRRKGSSLWFRLKAMYEELVYEIHLNNDIIKRHAYTKSKTPVLLLYGFFSSRRALNVVERRLTQKGYEVLSFNLGGLFGVFFTRGIAETARFIEYKLTRQFKRHEFSKVRIVAHSKGGLVALWWLLRLGGHRYCQKVVTMGTPFRGSRLTWLALVTPLGFFWKDVWEMRPGSNFLSQLHESAIPKGVNIYCLYSDKDGVATGEEAIFQPDQNEDQVHAIAVHNSAHFELLYKKEVIDKVADILGTPEE